MAKWIEGRVHAIRQWTDELYSLQVEAELPRFTAGQFTRLALEIDGEMVGRPYSFVNGPDNPLHEFYFIRVPDGPLTQRLIALQPGDSVFVAQRAAGFFILDEIPDAKKLWMLSTGTAIGPFLSILSTDEVWERFPSIVLVHAVRTVAELAYSETIQALLRQHAGQLVFIPFVSREETDFAIKGRVTAALRDGSLEARAGMTVDAADSQVMICGNPSMVSETQALLVERGMKKNRRREPGHITTEQYWKT
ncbi:MAG: ferredoxin--NADP(+) reductase [Gammaproteobacteria bacterium]|nr:ferredoxin--NADP(+) reductase [Gammaproteobacteria bacterium]